MQRDKISILCSSCCWWWSKDIASDLLFHYDDADDNDDDECNGMVGMIVIIMAITIRYWWWSKDIASDLSFFRQTDAEEIDESRLQYHQSHNE